jgi:hypothetical protein
MRTVIVVITSALALASSGAAAPISEGYRFPLAFFEPRQDPTARGDVYWSIGFATNAASACWQFGVFTRERTTHIYLRRAPAGRHGPIVDTFNMRPPSPEPRWSAARASAAAGLFRAELRGRWCGRRGRSIWRREP